MGAATLMALIVTRASCTPAWIVLEQTVRFIRLLADRVRQAPVSIAKALGGV